MNAQRASSPILVYNAASFAQMLEHLWASKLLALDTESDSLFSYYTKVCLIQISTYTHPPEADGSYANAADPNVVTDYLVDPLRFEALAPLGDLLADPACEVTIHAAENDLSLLQRNFNFTFANIFDTQLAARILGWERAGLAAILEEQFGVVSDKRMQRTNWGRRPLTPEQIAYAQMDTHYLPALRLRQIAELQTRDRWEEAQEAFGELTQLDYRSRPANERSIWQMKEARSVPHAQTGVLEELWLWREQEAQRQDRPPFKVVSNEVLVELTQRQPPTSAQLAQIRPLSSSEAARYSQAILAAVAAGKRRPLPLLPAPSLRPEQFLDKTILTNFDTLRRWRATTAEARGVAPDIILTNEVLLEIAKAAPPTLEELQRVAGIGPWKTKTYGPEILRIVRR